MRLSVRLFVIATIAVAAACRSDLLITGPLGGTLVGTYSLVATRSPGDTAFTGALTVTAAGSVTGSLSNFGQVSGQAVVQGDSLTILLLGHSSISVGLASLARNGLLAGTWSLGADGCWTRPCPHGPFTARHGS